MKSFITTAAVALTLTAATAAFAGHTASNRGQGLVRTLQQSHQAYALTGDTRIERKATHADRHPVDQQLSKGRGAF